MDCNLRPRLTDTKGEQGQRWKSFGRLSAEEAKDKFFQIKLFLRNITLKRIQEKESCPQIATLSVGEKEEDFIRSTAFQEVRKSVQESGVLVIDAKFTNGQYLKSICCNFPFSSGIDLFQFGGLSGHVCFIKVPYDCSALHKCNCRTPSKGEKCEAKNVPHKPFECSDDFQNHGPRIPKEVLGWLEDDAIIKVQSNIRRIGPVSGLLDRLEKVLGLCLKSFVELRNITYLWYNKQYTKCNVRDCPQKGMDFKDQDQFDLHMYQWHDQTYEEGIFSRSGNSFLAKELGLVPGEEFIRSHWGSDIWKADRRKPFQSRSNLLTYSDICDILVPAAFLLQIGNKIVIIENVACFNTNIYPYLRQMLLVLKNVPCLVGPKRGTSGGHEKDVRFWNGVEIQDIYSLAHSEQIPWRPGLESNGENTALSVKGEVISKNLRQLAAEIFNDAYAVGIDFQDLTERLRPNVPGVKCQENVSRINKPMCKASLNAKSSSRRKNGEHTREYVTEIKIPKLTPNHEMASPILYGRCTKCGSSEHKTHSCTTQSRCLYPLCPISRRSHDTSVCEVLHSICSACRLRGHKITHHETMDLVSLIKIAEAWAPMDVFASLSHLENDKESGKIQPYEE